MARCSSCGEDRQRERPACAECITWQVEARDRAKGRIRRLLEVKEYHSADEATAAATLIQELLTRHKIDLSEVEAEAERFTNPFVREIVYPSHYGEAVQRGRVQWTEDLLSYIAYAYFCMSLVTPDNNLLYVVGRRDDVAIAKAVFIRLASTALRLMREDKDKGADLRAMSPQVLTAYLFSSAAPVSDETYKLSYLTGFVRGVGERITATRRRLVLEAANVGSTALVRAERDVEVYVERETGGKHIEDLPTPELDAAALYAGMLRGKTVDINAGERLALNPREETRDE